MTTYGFIGLGSMGGPMAENLTAAMVATGDQVVVWNRSPGRDATVCALGAQRATGPADLIDRSSVVVLMVPDLAQIEELTVGLGGAAGVLARQVAPTVLVVCSSVSPQGIRAFGERVRVVSQGRVSVVDAPVSGGPEGAAAGSLAIMVGGDGTAVAAAWPALHAMGGTVRHLGGLGAGCLAKACNQMVVSATMIALSEATALAEAAGLDIDALLTVLGAGYAGSRVLETKGANLLEHRYPVGGRARYMVKDLASAAQETSRLGIELAQMSVSAALFEETVRAGLGDEDMSAVHEIVRARRRSDTGSAMGSETSWV
jgi:2-hydroxy-3-oxopropionate reductase